MNKKTLTLSLLLALSGGAGFAQNGLEGVIVEKYYVSNAADASGSIGTLPAGSVTYRIYADLLPGYNFQALYGVPGHTLTLNTTSSFFNNEDRGNTTPSIGSAFMNDNTVALDSWFSVGAAANGHFGILKSEDDGASNLITGDPVLLNNNSYAGIPLTTQDGMIAGTPVAVTFVGLDASALNVFNNTSNASNSFSTTNGSVAALGGATGPVPTTNKVLVGQFTTDGTFRFTLNMQIGTPTGGVQNFVASAASGSEISIPGLTFASTPIAPMVAATTVNYCIGTTATPLTATASPDCTLNWYTLPSSGVATSVAPTPSTSAAGTTTYYVSQTNSAGNEGERTAITVIVNPAPPTPVITAGGATSFCAGGSVVLTSSAATGNVWSTTASTQSITVTTSGTYTVVETDGNGCQATSLPTTVTVNAAPVAGGIVSGASGSTVTFMNMSTGATSYTWDFGDGNTSTATDPSHTYAANGNYTVMLIATNGGCSDTITFGTLVSVGITEAQATGVSGISLYPTPAVQDATIDINLAEATSMVVNVVDITGKTVANVFNGTMASGPNKLKVNVTALPAGVYFATIVSDNAKKILKIVVVK